MPEEEKPPGLHPQVDIFNDRGAAPLELDAGTVGSPVSQPPRSLATGPFWRPVPFPSSVSLTGDTRLLEEAS